MGWLSHICKKKEGEAITSSLPVVHCTFGVFCPKELQTSLRLHQFQFLQAIGHGYASTVFEAVHLPSKLHCVVKVCMKTRLNLEEMHRIRREIENHAEISHRHILTFFAAIEDDHAFYIVLHHAPHGDLYSYMRTHYGGKIPTHTFVKYILTPLLQALSYLHSKEILHRDLKPENVLIDEYGKPCICDFGLSIKSYKERPRSIVGTLEYMAPEVIIARRPFFTDRVDVWAIGVLTYECITGRCPFWGNDDDAIKNRIQANLVDYSAIASPGLRDFIQQCLQTDPTLRPSMRELLQHSCIHETI